MNQQLQRQLEKKRFRFAQISILDYTDEQERLCTRFMIRIGRQGGFARALWFDDHARVTKTGNVVSLPRKLEIFAFRRNMDPISLKRWYGFTGLSYQSSSNSNVTIKQATKRVYEDCMSLVPKSKDRKVVERSFGIPMHHTSEVRRLMQLRKQVVELGAPK